MNEYLITSTTIITVSITIAVIVGYFLIKLVSEAKTNELKAKAKLNQEVAELTNLRKELEKRNDKIATLEKFFLSRQPRNLEDFGL